MKYKGTAQDIIAEGEGSIKLAIKCYLHYHEYFKIPKLIKGRYAEVWVKLDEECMIKLGHKTGRTHHY